MKTLLAWIQAARLPSQSYIFLPLLVGQLIHYGRTREWSWLIFGFVCAFSVTDQLYIVFANDYADQETDAANETPTIFSGGSRVLVQGRISARALGGAAIAMAIASVTISTVTALAFDRWALVALAVAAVVLLWMYSYRPVALSYRGGGELLQMVGVGLVLPVYGYAAQAGTLDGFAFDWLWIILPTQLACAVATSLPDAPSDARTGKHTFRVAVGATGAKIFITLLNVAAVAHLVVLSPLGLRATETWLVAATPAFSTGVLCALAFVPTPAGRRLVDLFVFFAILATLSLMAGLGVLAVL